MCGHLIIASSKSFDNLSISSKKEPSKNNETTKKKPDKSEFDAVKYHTDNVQGIIKVTTLFGG